MNAILRYFPVILIFLVAGCQKEISDSPVVSDTAMEGSYRVVSCKENGIELFHDQTIFPPCELDNVVIIKASGSYEVEEGMNSCGPAKGNSGTWSLSGNTFFWDQDDYVVKDFSSRGFTLFYSYTDPQDQTLNYTEEITLQRQ
jgi:hypothetical protein